MLQNRTEQKLDYSILFSVDRAIRKDIFPHGVLLLIHMLSAMPTDVPNASLIAFIFQSYWRGLVDGKLVEAAPAPLSSNLIADRPNAALLFWFFGDLRCGVPLFIVILVIYEYKNR